MSCCRLPGCTIAFTSPRIRRTVRAHPRLRRSWRGFSRAGYPEGWARHPHAIEAHSYSAGIPPQSIEAKVVQDADRLDALGAIGVARCIAVGSALGRPLYQADDPFCSARSPDDSGASVDHFYSKLLKLATTMQTAAAPGSERRTASSASSPTRFGIGP